MALTLETLKEKISTERSKAVDGLAVVEAEIAQIEANIETRLRDLDNLRRVLEKKKVRAAQFRAQSAVLDDLG